MNKHYLSIVFISISTLISAQISSSDVYWVGHSLISHTDINQPTSHNLISAFENLSSSASKSHTYHQHTTPGAPLGWNWGANASAWSNVQTTIDPLLNPSNPNYGNYDVMVITEGVNLQSSYDWWYSSFYARKFFLAGKASNPNMRLFLYESWHHYNASDSTFLSYYGPRENFIWTDYMSSIRNTWETIRQEASSPNLGTTPPSSDYTYQGPGTDPATGTDSLEVFIIPTGEVFESVINRLNNNLPQDDWTFTGGVNGGTLTPEDFFQNPLNDFPNDYYTTIHSGQTLDDIHPSAILVYLNALVHFTVIYQENPESLPLLNGVPNNIADIFKEEVWSIVTNNQNTGVQDNTNSIKDIYPISTFKMYPNPTTGTVEIQSNSTVEKIEIINNLGQKIGAFKQSQFDISELKNGIYFVKVTTEIGTTTKRLIKQ